MRGKKPLEESVDVPKNIDLEESNAEDDELAFVIRSSREKHDRLQKRRGTESSNKALERSLPTIVSGAGVLSVSLIA